MMEKASRMTGPVSTAVVAAAVAAVVAGAAALTGTAHSSGPAIGAGADAQAGQAANEASAAGHWVHTWVSMPQLTEPSNMPPAPFTQPGHVMNNTTLRQTVHVSTGGDRIRLNFSNAFGGADLPITAVSVALPVDGKAGVGAVREGTAKAVTFSGHTSVNVPMGAEMVSDPLPFHVAPGSNLTVTAYLATGQASEDITSHPGSRTTSHMVAGNHLTDTDLTGAATADHWYFLSGVEVYSARSSHAVVVLGDSLTDGRGSTTNQNNRWPDLMLRRLQASHGTADIAVLNQAAGGNRLLNDGLGPNGLSRIDRDVLAMSGADRLLVFEGVNDIGTADATPEAQKKTVAAVTQAYEQIVTRAHAQGIKVYGATITPFGGNSYDDPGGLREQARQEVNEFIRTSGTFDAVVDLDRVARDPRNPRQLNPAYDTGDHLHFNPTGYQALADAVPVSLLR